jgi:hypothetical protein
VELRGFEPLTFSLRTTTMRPCSQDPRLASTACND